MDITESIRNVVVCDKTKLALYNKSIQSKHPVAILEEVYRRGFALWTESFGPSPEKFAFERVNSFIHNGLAAELDSDLVEKSNKPADREIGSDSLTTIYKNQTPGQTEIKKKECKSMTEKYVSPIDVTRNIIRNILENNSNFTSHQAHVVYSRYSKEKGRPEYEAGHHDIKTPNLSGVSSSHHSPSHLSKLASQHPDAVARKKAGWKSEHAKFSSNSGDHDSVHKEIESDVVRRNEQAKKVHQTNEEVADGTAARTKIEIVGRGPGSVRPDDTKSRLVRQGEIQRKVIEQTTIIRAVIRETLEKKNSKKKSIKLTKDVNLVINPDLAKPAADDSTPI